MKRLKKILHVISIELIINKILPLILFSALLGIIVPFSFLNAQGSTDKSEFDEDNLPPQVRFIRAYGLDNERFPPIILINNGNMRYKPVVGYEYITIEFDIAASVPPALTAKFVHCTYDWKESENIFLRDLIYNRTTIFDFTAAPIGQNFYSYKVKLRVPNEQVKFKFSGNWKVKIYDMNDEKEAIAETRFFVVEPRAVCRVGMFPEFYNPDFNVSTTGLVVEGVVASNLNLVESNVNRAVLYKNHRWFEPYVISSSYSDEETLQYRYSYATTVSGFVSVGKRFRIEGLPAENSYRIINLADLAYYPMSNQAVRKPFSDLRRDGNFFYADDDGAMITNYVPYGYEDYVYVEFILDPEGHISRDDVFVVGSFNNWKPDAKWKMFYDEKNRYYKLRQWVPRARHNYMFASGKLNIDNLQVERYSYDEFEGNTTAGHQTYIMFIYYHEFDYGGFDSIIAVDAANIAGQVLRYR